jgi:hypothetical protein
MDNVSFFVILVGQLSYLVLSVDNSTMMINIAHMVQFARDQV